MATWLTKENRAKLAEQWDSVLLRLAAGELIKDIASDLGVTPQAFAAYRLEDPRRKAEWETARELSADSLFDEVLREARRNDVTRDNAQHIRNRIDALKWAARIRNPRLYSDKIGVDMTVKTVDLTQIIRDAQARLAARTAERVIDGTLCNPEADHSTMRALIPAPASIDDLI